MMAMHAVKCIPMLAVSIGIGYAMCVVAEKQKGNLKTIGNILGMIILVVSIVLAVVCAGKIGCKMMKGDNSYPCMMKKAGGQMADRSSPMAKR